MTVLRKSAWCISSLILGGCGLTEPAPFDPRTLEQIQRSAAEEMPLREMRPLPTTLQSPIPPRGSERDVILPEEPATRTIGPTIQMALQEIIHRAVASNHDVRVAGYQAAIDEVRIGEALYRFDPSIFAQFQAQKQFQFRGLGPGETGALDPEKILTQTFQAGIRQNLISGGQAELRFQTRRFDFETGGGLFDPETRRQTPYENELVFQLTQPLLRNFGEVNRARINIARNDQRISELDFRIRLEEVLLEIERTYWQLALARRVVEIQEVLLQQAEETLARIVRRELHDASRVERARSLSTVHARRLDLVRATEEVPRLSDRLKRLMNDPDLPVSSPIVILPTDTPSEQPIQFSLAEQVVAALQNRAELLQQTLRIDSADVVVNAAVNNLLPELNAIAAIGVQGFGDNFHGALKRQEDFDVVNYTIGFAFEVPIGNRAPRAIYQRTLLQRLQSIEQYRLLIEQIAEEVKTAERDLFRAWNELAVARDARFAAEDSLLAIEQQEQNVRLDANFLDRKLARQEELAAAKTREAQALADYNTAIANLERAKGTLLRYNNIATQEAPPPDLPRRRAERGRTEPQPVSDDQAVPDESQPEEPQEEPERLDSSDGQPLPDGRP